MSVYLSVQSLCVIYHQSINPTQGLTDWDAISIADALVANHEVTSLNLHYNSITDKGAIALADLLDPR